ncbi:MAG: biliverdin-producing heme oxygenase [Xanthobacteraceae bacterium]|nr:biliverdin-producing heme oxygenase [Xanthobacteraceae bacterium]
MTSSLRDIIQDATARSHARFDAAITRADLRRADDYASFLRSQAEALFPLETALERHGVGDLLPNWEQRRRTPALEHDLAALDTGVDPLPVPELKRGGDHPIPEMLGVVYVLEGTRISARVILARIADEPDARIIAATAYLRHGFGRRFWPSFLATLESNPAARAHPARVIAGAQLGFGLFERALTPTAGITTEQRAAGHVRAA